MVIDMDRPVAIVTGAAHRIGRHIANTLARHGWNVVVHYRHSSEAAAQAVEELTAAGGRHVMIQADLAFEPDVRRLFSESVASLGRVDAVINNASVFEYDDALSFNSSSLAQHMLPNLAAPIILAQALHAHLIDSGRQGAVINLLDQKLGNLNPDFLSYTLAKSALKTATAMLAQALAPHVRVTGVSPGLTLPSHLQTEAEFQATHRMAPMGRASTPEDITRTVLFLLESPAITGVDLVVDGGQHLSRLDRDFSMLKSSGLTES